MTDMKKINGPRRKLYFAYGSNLNVEQFFQRCPAASKFDRFALPGYKLVFAGSGHADIVPCEGESAVEGALYEITRDCERALDRYEGFPHYYDKYEFTVQICRDGKEPVVRTVMVYSMAPDFAAPHSPTPYYLDIIRRGFDDWSIPHDTLDAAVHAAARRRPAPKRRLGT